VTFVRLTFQNAADTLLDLSLWSSCKWKRVVSGAVDSSEALKVTYENAVTRKTFIWISPAVETRAVRDFTALFPSCLCNSVPLCFEAWSEYLNRKQEHHCMWYYGNIFVILNGLPTIVEVIYRRLRCSWRANRMGNLRLHIEFRWETSSRTPALKTKNNLRRIPFE